MPPIKWLALFFIRMYQALHGSFYMGCCRFEPTCSHYAVEAIETHGVAKGVALSAFRIVRCQPFCKGGWDPVPTAPGAWDVVTAAPGNPVPSHNP